MLQQAIAEQKLLKLVTDLVDRNCRFTTRSLTVVQDRLCHMRGGVHLKIDKPNDFVSYRETVLTIGTLMMTVGCIDSTSGYDLSFCSGEEYIVTIPLRGSGWASTGGMFIEYSGEDAMIVAPLCRVDKHWDGPGEVLSIHIPVDRFDAALDGIDLRTLMSEPIRRIESRQLHSFIRVVEMVCSDIQDTDEPSPFLRAPFSDKVDEMLLTLLLEQLNPQPAVNAQMPVSPAIPYYVRRAEKFIAANANFPIGIEDIARAASVSARTVQYGFRKFFDTTPMLYLKQVRYRRARAILLSDGSGRKISDIALEIGCQNISQFSRDYRSLFGETPSHTLAMPKGLVC